MAASRKPKAESDTYTSKELCARYRCAQRTIRRKETEEGFPHGEKYGRNLVYAKTVVHDWERTHMPGLHTEAEKTEEDKQWDRMRRRHQLEQEERGEAPPKREPARNARAPR